jgi:hypothetical protein
MSAPFHKRSRYRNRVSAGSFTAVYALTLYPAFSIAENA